jgi:undecaprenyl-diphosphatase
MIDAIASHILALPGWVALLVVFLLPALESSAFVGFVFPGEIALILGGVLAYQGRVPLPAVIAAGIAGAVIGDSVGYLVGRRWGRQIIHGSLGRFIRKDHLDRGETYLRERGGRAVFVGRFTAALRVTIPGLAGMSRLHYRTFALYNVAGGAIWATGVILLGYLGGSSWHHVEHLASRIGLVILGLVVLAVVVGFLGRRGRVLRALVFVGNLALVRRTAERYPRLTSWLVARFDSTRDSGLALTVSVAAAVAASWVFLGVTQDVVAHEELARLDPTVTAWLLDHRTAWLTGFFRVTTWLGSSAVTVPVLAGAAVLLARARHSWRPVVSIVVVYGAAVLAYALAKLAVQRHRPPAADWLTTAGGWSYPSGHAAQAMAAWGILALLLVRNTRGGGRVALVGSAVVVPLVVAASRVYLGVHWLTDVLGGLALSLAILGVYNALRLGWHARQPDEPAREAEVPEGEAGAEPRRAAPPPSG